MGTIDYSVCSSCVSSIFDKKKQHIYKVGKIHGIGTREEQQDAFGMSNLEDYSEKGVLFVISDGMGGMQGGATISALTVISCLEEFDRIEEVASINLSQMLMTANIKAREYLNANGIEYGGATAIVLYLNKDKYMWASVGDSRLYLCGDKNIMKLNEEHTYFNQLMRKVNNGELMLEEALNNPQKEALTSYVGMKGTMEIDSSDDYIDFLPESKIMIVTDGIYRTISEESTVSIMKTELSRAMREMEYQILHSGIENQDNYTAIVIERCEDNG